MLRAWANIDGVNTTTATAPYSCDGTNVTVVLDNHRYLVGHIVNVTAPGLNGQYGALNTGGNYQITSVTPSTFTFSSTNMFRNATGFATSGATNGILTITNSVIRASSGIHSVAKTQVSSSGYATGNYAVNLETEMPDTNYCCSAATSWLDNLSANIISIATRWHGASNNEYGVVNPTKTSIHVCTLNRDYGTPSNPYNANYIMVSFFR